MSDKTDIEMFPPNAPLVPFPPNAPSAPQTNLPANISDEARAIAKAANETASFDKLLKFKKGKYFCDNEEVPLGTEYTAHCVGWTKCWIKFRDKKVADRKMFRVAENIPIPKREELDDQDQSTWEMGLDGNKPSDPWTLQYLLPLETAEGDLVIFVTSSSGGTRAVSDLCKQYARRLTRTGISAQPVVRLCSSSFTSKKFGEVARPSFDIAGWDSEHEGIRVINAPDTLSEELNDAIPF